MPRFNTHSNIESHHQQGPAPAYKNILNPLIEDEYTATYSNNNNNMINTANNHHHHFNHQVYNNEDMATLRAASHVSMEGTPEAHEYQPTCNCSGCQDLLQNFTNYTTLDAYTSIHLKFEAEQHQKYGRVPCIDGFYGEYGYAPVCTGVNPKANEHIYETMYGILTTSYLFHSHLNHMNPITAEVRQRSYDRYLANRPSTNNNNNNSNKNNNTPIIAVPAPRNFVRHNHTNNNNNVAAHTTTSAFIGTKKPSYVAAPAYNYTNTPVAAAPSYYSNSHQQQQQRVATTSAAVTYSERDINQAKRDVAFCGVASLGGF